MALTTLCVIALALSACRPKDLNKEETAELNRKQGSPEQWCKDAMTAKIKETGWIAKDIDGFGIDRNERTWDVWLGPRLLRIPYDRYPIIEMGRKAKSGTPFGDVVRMSVMIPSIAYDAAPSNFIPIENVSPSGRVAINCTAPSQKALRHTGSMEDHPGLKRRESVLGLSEQRTILGLRAYEWPRLPLHTSYYVPLSKDVQPEFRDTLIVCDRAYGEGHIPYAEKCWTGFAYSDALWISVQFPEAYLPHWRAIYVGLKKLIDDTLVKE